MNTNQVKGESKIVAGKVQKKVGKLVGSEEQQLKGQSKQITGHVQKGIGNIEQTADDAADGVENNIDVEKLLSLLRDSYEHQI